MKNLKWIVLGIIVIAVFAAAYIQQARVDNAIEKQQAKRDNAKAMLQAKLDNARVKLEEALSKNDFVNARAAAKILDEEGVGNKDTERVTHAEIGYLVNEGEFDMASQIATENDLPDAYYNKVAPNLVSIYIKYGAVKTILALSSCVLPIRGRYWGDHYYASSDCEYFNEKHNNYIKHLMEYMKLSNDKESISKVALFLTTEYPNGTKDVNAIKAKFGL